MFPSPEAFLNSELFKGIYFNPTFQSHLVSVVVDEARMIYMWGLVASGKIKGVASHARHGDRGLFYPSYGKLGSRLMATNGAPLLLMSATCPPVAIASILDSLRMPLPQAHFVWAELTRPEIWILQIPMKNSLASCDDLLQLYSPEEPSNNAIAPTLIYSCTINHYKKICFTCHQLTCRLIPSYYPFYFQVDPKQLFLHSHCAQCTVTVH
jgi:superfamily II DNA helicase RecQ